MKERKGKEMKEDEYINNSNNNTKRIKSKIRYKYKKIQRLIGLNYIIIK